jgi:large subunit ribosomal protein L15
MPFRVDPGRRSQGEWVVNESPEKLDRFYCKLFWGHTLLSEETRWLAVTHKTFDHGKRGYNDRLSYFGRRIVEMQATLSLVGLGKIQLATPPVDDGREQPNTKQLKLVGNANDQMKAKLLDSQFIFKVAKQYHLEKFIRWRPMDVSSFSPHWLSLMVPNQNSLQMRELQVRCRLLFKLYMPLLELWPWKKVKYMLLNSSKRG